MAYGTNLVNVLDGPTGKFLSLGFVADLDKLYFAMLDCWHYVD